jgi:5-methyltetrahydrofolate corrinoid/iron sulfur protein methyltransferase
MPELRDLVAKMMEGQQVDMASLSEKEQQYAKTIKVLMGKILYSDSWLES